MLRRIFLSISIALVSAIGLYAQQPVVVEAAMDSSVLWMGEQTLIHLSLTQDNDVNIILPQIEVPGMLTEGVEVLDLSEPDTTELQNNRILIKQDVLVTSFDSGFYYIPPFKYLLDEDTFATQSLSLKIIPVDVPAEAVASDVKDIKDVAEPPFVLWDFIPIWVVILILSLLLLAVAAYFAWRYFKSRKVELQSQPEVQIPPYELAMSELLKLRESKLWQQGQEKLYYTRLVDILREYLDSRFSINAMEMTSTQIMASLRRNKELKEVTKHIDEILSMADFVKFAKMRPLPEDNERVMHKAIDFVELTRPQPEPETEQPAPVNNQVKQ